jgi:hypothetical protein
MEKRWARCRENSTTALARPCPLASERCDWPSCLGEVSHNATNRAGACERGGFGESAGPWRGPWFRERIGRLTPRDPKARLTKVLRRVKRGDFGRLRPGSSRVHASGGTRLATADAPLGRVARAWRLWSALRGELSEHRMTVRRACKSTGAG